HGRAGVVEENVEPAGLLHEAGDDGIRLFLYGQIGGKGIGAAAASFDFLKSFSCACFGGVIMGTKRRPRPPHRAGPPLADAGSWAGDESDAILQSVGHRHVFPFKLMSRYRTK